MKVTLDNIGIISNSTINVNGITVITGKNNSGKTTSSKALYSLFSSVENLYENATSDIVNYLLGLLSDNFRHNRLSELCRRSYSFDSEKYNYDTILYNLNRLYKNDIDIDEVESIQGFKDYVALLVDTVKQIDIDYISSLKLPKLIQTRIGDIYEGLDNYIESFVSDCQDVLGVADKLEDFSEYEKRKIVKTLNIEFKNQILPVKIKEDIIGKISFENDDINYSMEIENGIYKFSSDLVTDEISNVIFLDDVTILDSANTEFDRRFRYRRSAGSLSSYIDVYDHKLSLISKLSKYKTIAKSIIDEESYEKIRTKIDEVFSDDIVIKDDEFVCSSDNLSLMNLAMGSKLFAILKMLLENGSINNKSLLILDEPEAHLHPEWQNILAEIIVNLVRELGVKVIITSHSPNFVLAIQTYSIKYDLSDVTNYYKTKSIDGYRVIYEDVSSDLTPIYSDFAKHFSYVKSLYDSLITGELDG